MTPTDIANMALSRMGEPAISDISENSPRAIACRTHYEIVRDSLLRSHPWNFAVGRAQLSATDDPAFGWEFAYVLPADFLRLSTLNGKQADKCVTDYTLESGAILTNSSEAKVTYVRRITDPTLFDPIFTEVLVFRLASAVAMAINKESSVRDEMEQLAALRLSEARFTNAGESKASVVSPVNMTGAAARGGSWYHEGSSGSSGGSGGSGGSATVDNASVNEAIEENPSDTRASLGLGTLATQNGTFSGSSSGTNTGDQDLSGLVVKANNLSDLASASVARTNLGLGTAATTASSAYEASGGIAAHAVVTSGVHGITPAAATVLDDATVADMRTTMGAYGSGSAASLASVAVVSGGHMTLVDSGALRITGTGTTNHTSFTGIGNWYGAVAVFFSGVGIISQVGALGTGRNGLNAVNFETTGSVVLGTYTVSTVPSAANHARGLIWISNESGGATPAFSDGTNWRRVSDRAIIS
jgi:hypothetical protein